MLGVALEFKNKPDTTTPINATNLNNMQRLLVDLIYPIGSYYDTSDSDFDPNVKWGGTWELDKSGTVLVSKASSSSSKFNANIGTIVGEEEHALTIDELADHNHLIYYPNGAGPTEAEIAFPQPSEINTTWGAVMCRTGSAGNGQAHNNVQPSKIINRWHRTA